MEKREGITLRAPGGKKPLFQRAEVPTWICGCKTSGGQGWLEKERDVKDLVLKLSVFRKNPSPYGQEKRTFLLIVLAGYGGGREKRGSPFRKPDFKPPLR